MKIKTYIFLGMTFCLSMSSCVSSKKYAQLQDEYNQTKEDLMQTKESLINCNAESRSMQVQLETANKTNEGLKAGMESLKSTLDQSLNANIQGNTNIAKLVDEINASNKYIKELVAAKSKSDSLSMVLTNKLTRSLSNDEMKDIDVKVLKGVVYISLADNMLFKTGSYEISQKAMESLGKIAKIIKDYSDYDVLVEGNTDNVPISRTNIQDNWDLSALRATSVVRCLQKDFGINPQRMTAGGRGEYNPIADNDTEVGKERNRRTEIIITPKLDQFMDLIDQAPETDD